jgi:hypothetical protein
MADAASLQPRSFGKIAVLTPGTPVRVTSDTSIRAHRIRFAVVIGETGRVFLGVAGMNKATGAGILREFWPTTTAGAIMRLSWNRPKASCAQVTIGWMPT